MVRRNLVGTDKAGQRSLQVFTAMHGGVCWCVTAGTSARSPPSTTGVDALKLEPKKFTPHNRAAEARPRRSGLSTLSKFSSSAHDELARDDY